MVTLFRRGFYTDASNLAASALLLGTHRSLGASSPVLELMERGPECLATIAAFALEPRSMAVSGSRDRTLRLWDLREGRCTATLEGHGDGVIAVAADFGLMRALSGSDDNTMHLWDLQNGRCTATFDLRDLRAGPIDREGWVGPGGADRAVTAVAVNFGGL